MTAVSDTVKGVQEVAELNDPTIAAIAHAYTAELYGLHIAASSIQDTENNCTRFIKIEPKSGTEVPNSADKCSVALDLPHQKGSLLRAISIINEYEHNIMTATSRPMPNRPWEYVFYIDFISGNGQENIQKAISELEQFCNKCWVLGVYENKSPVTLHPMHTA